MFKNKHSIETLLFFPKNNQIKSNQSIIYSLPGIEVNLKN